MIDLIIKKMIRNIFFINFVLISIFASAQVKQSKLKNVTDSIIRAEFPRTRVFNIEYGHSFSRDFESKVFDENFQKGEITNQKSINLSANIPIYNYKKWTFTASGNYKFNEVEFNNLDNIATSTLYEQNGTVNFHNFSTAISTTLFSSLFKKPLIYNGSIIVDGNDKGIERLKAFIGASIILKRTANTTITTGLIAFIDPTSQIPFFPTFTYNHKFENSPWEFDFILPQRVIFRRPISSFGRLSLGTEFGGNGFYVNVNEPNFPEVFEYSQLEINSGVTYEHKLSNNLIATFKGGLTNFVSNRLTEKGEPNKDYIYKNKQDATGYFNVGFSFNPFAKMKK